MQITFSDGKPWAIEARKTYKVGMNTDTYICERIKHWVYQTTSVAGLQAVGNEVAKWHSGQAVMQGRVEGRYFEKTA